VQPELSGPPDLETRLAEAASRARATRTVGGTLSPRAARDLRLRLLSEAPEVAPDVAATTDAPPTDAPPTDAPPTDAPAAVIVADEASTPSAGTRPSAIRVERRRWARDATPERVMSPAVTAPVVPAPPRPRTGRTRRWAVLGRLAVLLVVGAVLIGAATYASGRLTTPTALIATVVDATGATATRVGAPIQLTAGTVLQVGDTVTVSSPGHAVLALGASRVRMAGGSAVHLERLDGAGIGVSQLAGQVYYRVAPADHAPFHVTTGPVVWTAAGTAFDTDREPVAVGQGSGQERVTLLALQDAVTATGPGFDTTVPQGDRAIVYIGAASPTVAPALDAVPASALLDPWLQANGLLDQAAGLPLGILDGHLAVAVVSPSPSPTPFVTPSVSPTDTPFPTGLETPSPSPSPTAVARTPAPTPAITPGPTPSPTPGIGVLSLFATSCPGGVVLDWSKYNGKGTFSRYITLRSPSSDPAPPAAYPPSAGYIAELDGTTSKNALSGYDTYGAASQFRYRTLALDGTGKVLAASAARGPAGGAGAEASMTLSVNPNGQPMETDFSWTTFSGPAACFSQYEVRYAATSGGASTGTIAATNAGMGTSGIDGVAVAAGTHYFVVIVRRFTALGGSLVVAESAPVLYTVP
jgi:hypothetical protein